MRRSFLKALGGSLLTLFGVVLTIPAAAMLTFPSRKRTVSGADEPLDAGELARLPEGKPVRVELRAPVLRDAWNRFTDVVLGGVWLVRRGPEVRALSTVCPHAGCAVDWAVEEKRFHCPCHDSVFSLDGERLAGPAPRGMDQLPCAVENGRVRVRWLRYRQGVAGKEET